VPLGRYSCWLKDNIKTDVNQWMQENTWLRPMFMKRKNIIRERDSIMIGWARRVARRRHKRKGQSVVTKKNPEGNVPLGRYSCWLKDNIKTDVNQWMQENTWLWPMFMERKNFIKDTDLIMIGWVGRVARRQKTKRQSVVTKKTWRKCDAWKI